MEPTHRQLEIIALCARGLSRHEIGAELFISPWTVKRQLDDLRFRIEAKTTPHAIAICFARGFICVDGRSETVFIPEPFVLAA